MNAAEDQDRLYQIMGISVLPESLPALTEEFWARNILQATLPWDETHPSCTANLPLPSSHLPFPLSLQAQSPDRVSML